MLLPHISEKTAEADADLEAQRHCNIPWTFRPKSSKSKETSRLSGSDQRARSKVPTTLTTRQVFYIFIMHGIGAGIVSGGINFSIAWAMYRHTVKPIQLFSFPNTVAGDAALTVFLQTGITWFIEAIMVNMDIKFHNITPTAFISEPSSLLPRWFFGIDSLGGLPGKLLSFLWFNTSRLLAIAVPAFLLVWGPSMGIMVALGTKETGGIDYEYAHNWTVPLFKLVYAGFLAILTTPIMVAFWLLRAGWAEQRAGGGEEPILGNVSDGPGRLSYAPGRPSSGFESRD